MTGLYLGYTSVKGGFLFKIKTLFTHPGPDAANMHDSGATELNMCLVSLTGWWIRALITTVPL